MQEFINKVYREIYDCKKLYLLSILNKLSYEYEIKKISEKELFYGIQELRKKLYKPDYYVTKSKPDYNKKAQCLSSGQYYIVKEMNKYLCSYSMGNVDSIEFAERYEKLSRLVDVELLKECQRMLKADSQKRKRLRDRIINLLSSGKCYFITLTFNDKTLNNTISHIRRKYVTRWLKSNSFDYVGNIDFGKENGREHYHAVIRSDIFPDSKSWLYGFIDIQEINYLDSDSRLANYILKLTNHALKETTKRYALLYPNKKKEV